MLDWLGDEGRELESAFRKIIHDPPRQFGSPTLKFGGLSDGNQGVQWSAGFDSNRDYRGRATMEVTLLASGHRIKGPVSPHLSLQYLGTFRDWESFLTQGKARLEPFYQWAIRQCRPSAFLRENP
jgi:hypothetical protein